MLPQLLLARPQVPEELPAADGASHAGPRGPEVLHPAQGAAVQQDTGLGGLCGAPDKESLSSRATPAWKGGSADSLLTAEKGAALEGPLPPPSRPPPAPAASLTTTWAGQVHADGEVEVLGAEGPVRVVLLAQRHLGQELWGAQHHTVVVVGVPMAQPGQVQRHAQLGQVKEAAVVIPAGNGEEAPC